MKIPRLANRFFGVDWRSWQVGFDWEPCGPGKASVTFRLLPLWALFVLQGPVPSETRRTPEEEAS